MFDGENLEYTVTSSDHAVAIAREAAGILTISALSPGATTITVTAMNEAGSAAHKIKVAVPEPATTPTPIPSILTIKLHETVKHTLPSGQFLIANSDGVGIEKSLDHTTSNVWFITALKRGAHTISVFGGVGIPETVGDITVNVPNSPPARKHDVAHPATVATTNVGQLHTTGTYTSSTQEDPAKLDLYDFFSDDDGDTLHFRVGGKPSWVLMDSTHSGFVKTVDDPIPMLPKQGI